MPTPRLHLIAALLLGLALSAGAGPATAHAERTHFTMEEGVRLAPEMRSALERIAREFLDRTGRRIHVTSGTRSAREQADAMYDKLRLGQRLTSLYRDYDAASEIQAAYRSHRQGGRGRCVRAMARVIARQVGQGRYISRHLVASAVDVRSRNLSRRERRVFREVVSAAGGVTLLEEGTPPHFHLQLR